MGCYFLCLHYYVKKYKGIKFYIHDININYHKFTNLGYIRSNCYILDPCKILKYFGLKTSIRREHKAYRCSVNEFEISEVKIEMVPGSHFIATNYEDVLYDSLSLKERGKDYQITSKRVFKTI